VSRAAHWPAQIYLVATGQRVAADASAATMGAKAWHLLQMTELGLPVPPALVIGTRYTQHPSQCESAVFRTGLPELERLTGQVLGDTRRPLMVSVRSGAPVSMPGMMETLLNIGLSDRTLPGFLRQTGNPRLVWDAYRRLVSGYGEVVAGLPPALFEQALRRAAGNRDERQLDFRELRQLTRDFLALYREHARSEFPQDVHEQLRGAIHAVFASWRADKAAQYRRLNGIDEAIGTAVTVQRMVFGNAGNRSGAGVGFTRDPATGAPGLWVDYLPNAQGEDVVSGRRNAQGHARLEALAPAAWRRLQAAAEALERAFGDMQDFEFTVENGELFLLQTRAGKRTPVAAVRIALDLHDEGLIDAAEALARCDSVAEDQLVLQRIAAGGADALPLARAVAAGPGITVGEIALDPQRAIARANGGAAVVLVRAETETGDIAALALCAGVLTARGARTSHAAVVARQLGKVCLVGCEELAIEAASATLRLGALTLREGDIITLDGSAGCIYRGAADVVREPDAALIGRLRALREAGAGARKAAAPAAAALPGVQP
jgi:pyruvate,orthophosphate dikinase